MHVLGSKDEMWFDATVSVESDCDEDFHSVQEGLVLSLFLPPSLPLSSPLFICFSVSLLSVYLCIFSLSPTLMIIPYS